MSQWHSRPAISRSELVSVPVRLSSDTRQHCISGGNGIRQTIGGRNHAPPNQTPPAPCLDASQYPMKSGGAGTKSAHGVGCLVAIFSSSCQSRRACLAVVSSKMCLRVLGSWLAMSDTNGERSALPFGMA